MKQRTVDVIIPTCEPDERFYDLLNALQQQSYPIAHILIMNTDESKWDPRIQQEFPDLEVFHVSRRRFDHGGTRDEAVQMSLADIVIFFTQDAVPTHRDLISRLVHAFHNPDVRAAYGRQLPDKDCNSIERYSRLFNYPPQSVVKGLADLPKLGIKTFFCSNVCAAYDRATYLEVGGFERRTIFNEDMIYAGHMVKKGYKIAYVAQATVVHSHNYSTFRQFQRNFDLAVSQAQHPEVFAHLHSSGEGLRMIINTARQLCRHEESYMLFKLFWVSGWKFIGFRLGKIYRYLPKKVILFCSMNKGYWRFQKGKR